jgi:putative aldouronate transport system permease protein
MKASRKAGETVFDVANVTFMLLVVAVMMYPFLNILAYSLSNGLTASATRIYLIPREPTFYNYAAVLANNDIGGAFVFSVVRTLIGTLTHLLVTAVASYALSKKSLPGRTQIIVFLYIPTIVGGGLIPTYMLYRALGFMNNFLVYVIPSLFGFYNMILMRTFFEQLPSSLEESATMDGAGPFGTFARIVVPLSTPVIATVSLFSAVGHWNDWFTTLLYCSQRRELWTLQYILQLIVRQAAAAQEMARRMNEQGLIAEAESLLRRITVTPMVVQYATLIIATFPILVVYPFLQRYFVKGVMVGAIKS